MGIQNQQFIKHLLIGSNKAVTTGTTVATMAAGDVAVVDMSGLILNATTVVNEDRVQIVQSQGSSLPPIISPPIKKSSVTAYRGGRYIAPVQQIDFAGYNGTSGSIDVLNNNAYSLMVQYYDNQNLGQNAPKVIGYHKSDGTATQAEVAAGVQQDMTDQLSGFTKKPFTVEVLSSAADIAMTGPGLIFTNGSRTVVGDATTALSVTLAEGDWIKVATGTGATTGVSYKVKSFVAAGTNPVVITLESVYQGTTATIVSGTHVYFTAATAATANFGFKITGLAQTVSQSQIQNGGLEEYSFVRFKTQGVEFGTTTITSPSTVGVAGSGVAAQVGVLERQLLGNEGFLHPGAFPFVSPRSNTNFSAAGYGFVHLMYGTDTNSKYIVGDDTQLKTLDIAFELSSAPSTYLGNAVDAGLSVAAVLDSWLNPTIDVLSTDVRYGII